MEYTLSSHIHIQSIILVTRHGKKFKDTMRCVSIPFIGGIHLQFPRSIIRFKKRFIMFKYSEREDLVYYQLENFKKD